MTNCPSLIHHPPARDITVEYGQANISRLVQAVYRITRRASVSPRSIRAARVSKASTSAFFRPSRLEPARFNCFSTINSVPCFPKLLVSFRAVCRPFGGIPFRVRSQMDFTPGDFLLATGVPSRRLRSAVERPASGTFQAFRVKTV